MPKCPIPEGGKHLLRVEIRRDEILEWPVVSTEPGGVHCAQVQSKPASPHRVPGACHPKGQKLGTLLSLASLLTQCYLARLPLGRREIICDKQCLTSPGHPSPPSETNGQTLLASSALSLLAAPTLSVAKAVDLSRNSPKPVK